jgi:predicted lipoprotein with Yx(FWY)xxD motif
MTASHPTIAVRAGAAIAASALLVAACSSSKSHDSTTKAGAGGQPAASGVTLETHSGPMGTYLTDSNGKALYMFAADTSGTSNCTGQCLSYWPPLTTSGTPKASSGVTASKLGTIMGANGQDQVTYGGHPLYLYVKDKDESDTYGQGSTNFGAKWWLVAPSGQPITTGSSNGSSSGPSSSSGGGGGWS